MRSWWGRNIHGERRKFDRESNNNYSDGYYAGRVYWKRKLPWIILWSVVLGQVITILVFGLGKGKY